MWYRIEGHKGTWEPFKAGRSSVRGGFVIRYSDHPRRHGPELSGRISSPHTGRVGIQRRNLNVLRFRVA